MNTLSPPPFPPDSLAFALTEAANLVCAVQAGGNLTDALAARRSLTPGQRGAVMDLTYGTLRDFGRGDFLLGRLLHKPITDPALRGLLLVALHRLERRPDQAHVVVDQAVFAAALINGGVVRGLANAVLRNFLRGRDALLTAADADEVAYWRHPRWWIKAVRGGWGHEAADVLAAGNTHPPMALRVNRRRASRDAVLGALAAAGISGQLRGQTGILLETPCPVSELPGFAAGEMSVQDLGAQQAALMLAPENGMRVLDACAAPGGKAAHMLEYADIDLLALDADAGRADRIHQNLDRLGLVAEVRVADCRDTQTWWDGRPFDCILADVPCSASGVARRHPDIKWLRRAGDIEKFARQQRDILESLWPLLKPGGRLLYATCSVFREENQDQVADFCADHGDAERVLMNGAIETRLAPGAEYDGFYYALLKKRV